MDEAECFANVLVRRQLRELHVRAGLQVRAAGIVGRDDDPVFEQDLRIARNIDAAIDFRIEIGRIERRNESSTIPRVRAGDVGGERMALPIRGDL